MFGPTGRVTVVPMTSNAPSNAPISVSTPADILSYIPHVLGFQPQESLVFLTMSGKRVGATLRLDLPPEESDPLHYADTVREYLEADSSADGVLMILYTDQRWEEPSSPPRAALVHGIDLVLDGAGLPLLDGWLVGSGYWRDYFCQDAACCPWTGHPLTQITESILNAELVYQGSAYAESVDAAVGALGTTRSDELHRLTSSYAHDWEGSWDRTGLGRDSLALWDVLIREPLDLDGEDNLQVVAFLLAGLGCAAVRDSLIVLAATGFDQAVLAAVDGAVLPHDPDDVQLPPACEALRTKWAAPPMIDTHDGSTGGAGSASERDFVPGASGPGSSTSLFREVFLATLESPDWNRLDAAHALFLRLSAVATGQPRSALLSILGWLEWARGRGSRAHRYLEEALAVTPGYTLAELLLALVGTGSLAPWARRRETAWTSDSRRMA